MPHYHVTATVESGEPQMWLIAADNARSAARKVLGYLMQHDARGEVVIKARHNEGKIGALEVCERRTTLKGKGERHV